MNNATCSCHLPRTLRVKLGKKNHSKVQKDSLWVRHRYRKYCCITAFMKGLTQKEVISVIKMAETARNRAMIVIGYRHGMRASEVCGLKAGRCGPEEQRDHYSPSQRVTEDDAAVMRPHRRTAPIGETALAGLVKRTRRSSQPIVFVSQKSGRINRSQFYRIFSAAAEAAGLPADRRHPHCLKHALGFNLVAADMNLAKIKQALGHKNIASTAIYTVPTDEQVGREVARALASL